MSWKLSNFMTSRLAQAITAAATTIYVDSDDVDLLPTLGVGDKAKAVIFNATDKEIVNITAWNTDGTLTVERGKESTTGTAFAAGTKITHTPTAEILQAVLDATVQAVYRGTATGTNAITVTGSGSTPTPSDGDEVSFEVAATNTAAVTISYTNGSTTIGPFDLVKQDRSALRTGELVAGYRAKAVYDASSGHFVLVRQGSKRYDITHVNTGPLDAGNLLPNGGLDDWHNGTNFATPASGTETAGNLVATYDGTIGAFTVSRQTFTLGQTDVPGGPKYFARWDQSSAGAASSFRRLRMKVPRVGKYALETVIASIYAKADIARNVTAKLIQSFGTGGGPSAEVTLVTETWNLTTAWQMFDITSLVSNINGKTLGSAGDDGLILELGLPVNTSMTIDFAMGQIELGDVASKTHSRLPWSTEQGGSGGVYPSLTALAAAIMAVGTGSAGLAQAWDADLDAVAALGGTGFAARTAANTWAQRTLQQPAAGMTITNPAGIAGDPTFAFSTGLVNYIADPMSVAELASITAPFGTAAFVNTGTSGGNVPLLNGANIWSANQAFSTYLDLIFPSGNASGRISGRYNIEGTFHDAVVISDNYKWDTGAIDSAALGTAMVLVKAQSSGPGLIEFWTGAVNTAPTRRAYVDASGVWSAGALALTTATGAQLAATNTFTLAQIITDSGNQPLVLGGTGQCYIQYKVSNVVKAYVGTDGTDFLFYNGSAVETARITAGGDLRLTAAPTSLATNSAGFRGAPLGNSGSAANSAYTFVIGDSGCTIYHDEVTARTYTIPANASVAFPVGTTIVIDNTGNSGAAGAITLSITSDTLRRGDGVSGTGSRTIPASAVAVIRKVTSTLWIITGVYT